MKSGTQEYRARGTSEYGNVSPQIHLLRCAMNPTQFSSFEDVQAAIKKLPKSKREPAFREFTRTYLLLNPGLGIKEVWQANDPNIPAKIRKKLTNLAEGDLVAQRGSQVWVIRPKMMDPKAKIDKKEIFSMKLSATGADKTILVTDKTTLDASSKKLLGNSQISTVEGVNFQQLNQDFFSDWQKYHKSGKVPKRKRAKPRPDDQGVAIEKLTKALEKADRTQMLAACGFGKTLVGLWVTEKMDADRVIVFTPSLHLVDQTLRSWATNAQGEIDAFCVCSDKSVGQTKKGRKDEEEDLGHTSVPVDTDPEAIKKWWNEKPKKGSRKVCFVTLQSVETLEQALKGQIPADLMLLDEAHRIATVGDDKMYHKVLHDKHISAKKRMFMTATPRIAGEEGAIVSMDNKKLFGEVGYEINFAEAIERGLLSDFEIEVLAVTDEHLKRFTESTDQEAKLQVHAATVVNAIEQGKFKAAIAFHNRIKGGADKFTDYVKAVAKKRKLPIHATTISGETPIRQRELELAMITQGYGGVASSANALSEGVDVPAVDAVVFCDPTSSVVKIAQAIGRALRLDPKNPNKKAKIILPVILPENNPEMAVEDTDFKHVWKVLEAIMAHDRRLEAEIRRRVDRDEGEEPDEDQEQDVDAQAERIKFHLPAGMQADDFVRAFNLKAIRRAPRSDVHWADVLRDFAAENGHAAPKPSTEFKGRRLGHWYQRIVRGDVKLSNRAEGMLKGLPFFGCSPSEVEQVQPLLAMKSPPINVGHYKEAYVLYTGIISGAVEISEETKKHLAKQIKWWGFSSENWRERSEFNRVPKDLRALEQWVADKPKVQDYASIDGEYANVLKWMDKLNPNQVKRWTEFNEKRPLRPEETLLIGIAKQIKQQGVADGRLDLAFLSHDDLEALRIAYGVKDTLHPKVLTAFERIPSWNWKSRIVIQDALSKKAQEEERKHRQAVADYRRQRAAERMKTIPPEMMDISLRVNRMVPSEDFNHNPAFFLTQNGQEEKGLAGTVIRQWPDPKGEIDVVANKYRKDSTLFQSLQETLLIAESLDLPAPRVVGTVEDPEGKWLLTERPGGIPYSQVVQRMAELRLLPSQRQELQEQIDDAISRVEAECQRGGVFRNWRNSELMIDVDFQTLQVRGVIPHEWSGVSIEMGVVKKVLEERSQRQESRVDRS